MTVIRLADGSLMLHSPVQCNDETRALVEELGPVRYVVSPNKLHHFFLGRWAEACPGAEIWAPPGLRRKRRPEGPHCRVQPCPSVANSDLVH